MSTWHFNLYGVLTADNEEDAEAQVKRLMGVLLEHPACRVGRSRTARGRLMDGAWCQAYLEHGEAENGEAFRRACGGRLDCGLCCDEHPDHDPSTCPHAFCCSTS
jgi:hypothetical protein